MKICFININIYSLFNSKSEAPVGGTEVQLFNISKYLGKDNKISIITGNWGQKDKEVYDNIQVTRSFDIRNKSLINYLLAPFILWNKMKSIQAEVYVASSAGAEVGIIAMFCKLKKKKFIYRTAHDMDCNGEFVSKNGVVGKMYKYGLEKADIVVVQNEDNQKMLKKNYNITATIMKNAYELNSRRFNFGSKKYILWVARCSKWKRPELFLKIVKEFPAERFLMISPMVSNEIKLFHKTKKRAAQLPNLKFIEGINFFEIQRYFNKAKLFIGTSDYEGFPNTYLQACMGSTPIVSLRVNPDKFITKNNLGYCADGDFKVMIKQVNSLLNKEHDWKRKSKNALRYMQKNHNIEVTGEKWRRLIKNVVE